MNKWIPLKDQMPMTGQNVLLCDNDGGIFIGSYFDYEEEDTDPFWVFQHDDEDFCFDEPIAWMPLPEPYAVEDETK